MSDNFLKRGRMNLEEITVRVVPYIKDSCAMNLAREEALFHLAKEELKNKGIFDPIIGLYSFNKKSVILGNQQPMSEIDLKYCEENDIDVTMRKTGGGSVFLSPNEMQYFYILPFKYSRQLLKNINIRIQAALGNAGFSPKLKLINNFHILRMNEDLSFVFDAQRGSMVYRGDENNPYFMLLHHGTILVDDSEYKDHMANALKANEQETKRFYSGNFWLKNQREVGKQELIKSLQKTLPFNSRIKIKNYTQEENNLAKKFHDEFYSDKAKFSNGKKAYGICYLPGPDYDMNKYRVEEKENLVFSNGKTKHN